jgi:hypothetical protein
MLGQIPARLLLPQEHFTPGGRCPFNVKAGKRGSVRRWEGARGRVYVKTGHTGRHTHLRSLAHLQARALVRRWEGRGGRGACEKGARIKMKKNIRKEKISTHLRAFVHLQARAAVAVDDLGHAARAPRQRLHDADAAQPRARARRAREQPLRERAARPEVARVQLDLLCAGSGRKLASLGSMAAHSRRQRPACVSALSPV